MWSRTTITEKIGFHYPIIQAPMAGGATTPELVAAVSNSGGLGSLGAGYMSGREMKAAIEKIRKLTDKPFSVNLFVPEKHFATSNQINQMCRWIEESCSELKTKISPETAPYAPIFDEQMKVILEEDVPVFSFTFGLLDGKWMELLKQRGIILIGTATSLEEASLLAEHQVDAVVAQGCESGGHRGTFIGDAEDAIFPVELLVRQIVNNLKIPVIAAGGIMDAKTIASMLALGAAAVQMGTAFLGCDESGINSDYKNSVLNAKTDNTTFTRVFSGKLARGLKNTFIERMELHQNDILDYPIQNALTRTMRNEAVKQGDIEFMSMWAGQSVHLCKASSAAELIANLIRDVSVCLNER